MNRFAFFIALTRYGFQIYGHVILFIISPVLTCCNAVRFEDAIRQHHIYFRAVKVTLNCDNPRKYSIIRNPNERKFLKI